jgi:hypothetical protein
MTDILCTYCRNPATLVPGSAIYPHREDLAAKRFWHCAPCGAWVGCHPGTTKPLGILANAELRRAKQGVHAVFDPLWQAKQARDKCGKGIARRKAYAWLARELGIAFEQCHVGMFDEELCQRAVEICSRVGSRKKSDARASVMQAGDSA